MDGSDMDSTLPQKKGPWGWTVARLVIGFIIPLPILFLVWLGLAINNTYFRDTFDPGAYLIETSIYYGPAIAIGVLVMLLRIRHGRADKIACLIGGAILLLVLTWFTYIT